GNSPSASVLVSVSAAALRSEFEGEFPTGEAVNNGGVLEFPTAPRHDTQYSAKIGLDWKDFPARYWGIGTQVTYIKNRSSLSLFEYDRVDASVMLRREFR